MLHYGVTTQCEPPRSQVWDRKCSMILGIDLGTSMVKAARFAHDGTCLAVASRRSSPTVLGGGRIEQDFEEIVTAVGEVVAEACAGAPAPLVIGITGQSDGLWLLDADGRGVRPAVSWHDRGPESVLQLLAHRRRVGGLRRLRVQAAPRFPSERIPARRSTRSAGKDPAAHSAAVRSRIPHSVGQSHSS